MLKSAIIYTGLPVLLYFSCTLELLGGIVLSIERFHVTSRRPCWCSKTKGTAAILVYKANPLGIELYFYANTFFCFIKQYGRWSRESKRAIGNTTDDIVLFLKVKLDPRGLEGVIRISFQK